MICTIFQYHPHFFAFFKKNNFEYQDILVLYLWQMKQHVYTKTTYVKWSFRNNSMKLYYSFSQKLWLTLLVAQTVFSFSTPYNAYQTLSFIGT